MKDLLLIAFHFPPYGQGSGVHRAARFAEYLPDSGWKPHVLTASPRAYECLADDKQSRSSSDTDVTRALALDAQRHLTFFGWYPRWLALPDRWSTWVLGAIPSGLAILFRKRIHAICVTFPIATAVLVGWILHRLSRKPLIVDFRDSMTEDGYPRDRITRRIHLWIERGVISRGSTFIFTTMSARKMYLERYTDLDPARCVIIPNGYDEGDFADIVQQDPNSGSRKGKPVRMVHAGVIYPDDRDPRAFFQAVHRAKQAGQASRDDLRIDLRASGSEEYYSRLLRELEIDDIVHLLPGVSHLDALRDNANADALLLFQAASCDHQIPAKVYEYLRLGKPILALTSSAGDTAALLRKAGGATIANLTDEDQIADVLPRFLDSVRQGAHPLPDWHEVRDMTRKNSTVELAKCLDGVVGVHQMRTAQAS